MQQRLIADIESLDDAIKIARDVEAAYHKTIEENISYWWAVEEDIIESYTKLMNQTDNERVKSTMSKIMSELRDHVEILESMRESFKKLLTDCATSRQDAANIERRPEENTGEDPGPVRECQAESVFPCTYPDKC